ncbi:MAG TPA: glucokinase [Rhodanobacteraceae bacterium]|nr:glucokinase [Rhodanobacteraceae bacterium]
MVQAASRQHVVAAPDAVTRFVAADVGGTHARVALASARAGQAVELSAYHKYNCSEWPDLAAILSDFIEREARQSVSRCALAIAGYLIDDRVVNENLVWPVTLGGLRARLKLDDVALVNDFAALAYAIEGLGSKAGITLGDAVDGDPRGPRVVLGPGTGLGAALILPQASSPLVLATEAGQAALAPRTALEREILGVMAAGDRHVSTESALSGPGIVNLYNAVVSLRGGKPQYSTPSEVVTAALGGTDPLAQQALDTFAGLLGSFAGDLALIYGASGGVALAGGVLGHLHDYLPRSAFVERFLDKGRMRAFLERVPVRLLDHGRLGVLGAAGWYLDQGGAT